MIVKKNIIWNNNQKLVPFINGIVVNEKVDDTVLKKPITEETGSFMFDQNISSIVSGIIQFILQMIIKYLASFTVTGTNLTKKNSQTAIHLETIAITETLIFILVSSTGI